MAEYTSDSLSRTNTRTESTTNLTINHLTILPTSAVITGISTTTNLSDPNAYIMLRFANGIEYTLNESSVSGLSIDISDVVTMTGSYSLAAFEVTTYSDSTSINGFSSLRFTVTATPDPTPGVQLLEDRVTINEGESVRVGIRMATPVTSGSVTVNPSINLPSTMWSGSSTMRFYSSNWFVPQYITFRSPDDNILEDNKSYMFTVTNNSGFPNKILHATFTNDDVLGDLSKYNVVSVNRDRGITVPDGRCWIVTGPGTINWKVPNSLSGDEDNETSDVSSSNPLYLPSGCTLVSDTVVTTFRFIDVPNDLIQ